MHLMPFAHRGIALQFGLVLTAERGAKDAELLESFDDLHLPVAYGLIEHVPRTIVVDDLRLYRKHVRKLVSRQGIPGHHRTVLRQRNHFVDVTDDGLNCRIRNTMSMKILLSCANLHIAFPGRIDFAAPHPAIGSHAHSISHPQNRPQNAIFHRWYLCGTFSLLTNGQQLSRKDRNVDLIPVFTGRSRFHPYFTEVA